MLRGSSVLGNNDLLKDLYVPVFLAFVLEQAVVVLVPVTTTVDVQANISTSSARIKVA